MKIGDGSKKGPRPSRNRTNSLFQRARANKAGGAEKAKSDDASRRTKQSGGASEDSKVRPTRHTSRADALDRDPNTTESDPAAAREQVHKAGGTSRRLTDDAPAYGSADPVDLDGEPTTTSRASQPENTKAPEPELVDDPLDQEQELLLEDPPESVTGEIPPPPNLEGVEPTSETTSGNLTVANYEHEGVRYQQVRSDDGAVSLSYTQGGVSYQTTNHVNGGTTQTVSQIGENGISFSRTVRSDAQGQLESDQTQSRYSVRDPQSGERTVQTRTIEVDSSLKKTTTEELTRPGGAGRSTRTTTDFPDGSSEESYLYEGDEGTRRRTTNTDPAGTSTTLTEISHTTDQAIESAAENAPIYTERRRGAGTLPTQVPPLPDKDRSPTEVVEVEVVVTDARGNSTVQHQETTWTQSSTDVEALDGTLPSDVTSTGGKATRTYSTGQTRNEDGDLVDFATGSQTVEVTGDRQGGGAPVRIAITEGWNEQGQTSTSYNVEGLTRAEQAERSGNGPTNDPTRWHNPVRVGEEEILASSWSAGKDPEIHLATKDNKLWSGRGPSPVEDFLGAGDDEVVNVSGTVTRDADRSVTSDLVSWEHLDEDGNGQTVSRDRVDDTVSWSYTDLTNDGKDYQRQTVVEGSPVSTFESHRELGEGEWERSSETTLDGEVIANSTASRTKASEQDLEAAIEHQTLTTEQVAALKAAEPPYYLEIATNNSEAREGEPERQFLSTTYSSQATGYSAGRTTHVVREESGKSTVTTLDSTNDVNSATPFSGILTEKVQEAGSRAWTETDSGELSLDHEGNVRFNGEIVSSDNRGAFVYGAQAEEGLDLYDGASYVGGVANSLADTPGADVDITRRGNYRALSKFTDVLSGVGGAADIYSGVRQRDLRAITEGVGDSSALAGHLIDLTGRGGTKAAAVSKFLGKLGPGIGIGFGVKDALSADSGYDRAAGWLTVGSGVAALLPGPGTAVSVVLALTALWVGSGDDNDTAGLDPRLSGES